MYERVCIVAAMGKSVIGFGLCTIRIGRTAMANRIHRTRWPKTKRSTSTDWRYICVSIVATIILAHLTAYATLYKTDSTETNHTHFVDGTHLFGQCGNLSI